MEPNKTKFLIVRFSSIGDIVFTTPLIRCLKEQYPGAEIHYVVKKKFAMVLANNPYIDQLHFFEGNLMDLVARFKQEHFDYIIDLHKTIRSYLLRFLLRRKVLTFRKLSIEKLLITRLGVDLLPKNKHIVERILDAVKPLNVYNDFKPVDYFLRPDEQFDIRTLPAHFQQGFVAFVIGGQHFTKRLPFEKLRAICSQLQRPIVLVGGPEDKAVADQLERELGDFVYNVCGRLSFNTSVSVIAQATVVVAHDTGLLHIAGAFNKPVVSVWGATSPDKFGVWPYLISDHYEARVPGLRCHPCSNFGTESCPRGHFACMWRQDEKAIVNEVRRMMQTHSGEKFPGY